MSHRLRRGAALAASAALALTLAACGGSDAGDGEARGTEENPVRIGVVGASDPQWEIFSDLAEEEGIFVEIIDFTEYPLPNPALTDGDLDLNQFQHILYLAQYNEADGEDLTPIGATAVYPLGVYSLEHTDVADIPDGGEIAIPNDVTNQARALFVLEEAGLIALNDDAGVVPDPTDIDEASSRVTVTPVDANQTVVALDSVDASVVNNDFVADAGLEPADAIFEDSAESEGARPYINIFVSRAEDAQNETYLKLVEIFHDEAVTDALLENSGGTASIADQPAEELQEILAEVQASLSE
ncbi:MetQ/NlpA family ABC transporter substrate-binding protein [Georgenia subflava]|uniref:Methionine ABC transporter substrate-binding protein n=1 Tax=Georgenia subflava TaxID=1622177 RepID=A0A6N7EHI7_9MICO|nr:MetQ/NlpA family ABC transporter substrate-binding protein [Georgenia subflava]MPV37510.1 methionine ABC transporter substrate-binding protein [Georgenia subflava]